MQQNLTLTLEEFQHSQGIAIEEQLILVNNKHFFSGFEPVLPAANRIEGNSLSGKFISRIRGRLDRRFLQLPKQSNKLFLGFFNKSFDQPRPCLGTLFNLISKSSERKFKLVIGKGDYETDLSFLSAYPANLDYLIANNVNVCDDRIRYLPMGRDFRNLDLLGNRRPKHRKTNLCYCNFSVDTHPVRGNIYDALKGKDFIKFQHMGAYLRYPISREDFLGSLETSKYCICPRGNGLDTFRMWDCLYSGTIPIVLKEAAFHSHLEDLPILFLEDHRQFSDLTRDKLEGLYREFQQRRFNFQKLTRSFWLDVNEDHKTDI